MSFDIFDAISDATKEADAFENHPAKELSLEERLLYLQGLALVMNADKNIHDEEKEYLRILIKSLEMDEKSILEMCIDFAQAPDKDTIQAFFRAFRRKPIAQLFLFDAIMMSRRDGIAHENETKVLDKIAEQLEILKGTQKDIYDLFCHIKNRNWQESALYFDSFLLNPKHFKHLLAYHEVDFDALMLETAEIRQSRLGEALRAKFTVELEWVPLKYERGELPENITSITRQAINLKEMLSIETLLPYLQSRLDRGELRVNNGEVYFTATAKEGEGEFFSLSQSCLAYHSEILVFSIEGENKELIPDAVIESFICFMQGEACLEPSDINRVLLSLFGAKISQSIDYHIGLAFKVGRETVLPKINAVDEVCLHHDGYFIKGTDGEGTSSYVKMDVTVYQVLINEKFHLMR